VQVLCGHCAKAVEVEDSLAGTTVACPHCGEDIDIPLFDESMIEEAVASGRLQEAEGFAGKVREAMARKIRVVCGSCGRGLTVAAARAGKKANCPACGKRIRIPYPTQRHDVELREPPEKAHEELLEIVDIETGAETDELDPGGGAAATKARGPGLRAPGRTKSTWAVVCIVGAVIAVGLALGIWLGSAIWPRQEFDALETAPDIAPARSRPPTDFRRVEAPEPRERPHYLKLIEARSDVFAVDGYRPAAPWKIYWKLKLQLVAGADGLRIETYGDGIQLKVGTKTIPSLGTVGAAGAVRLGARRETIELSPGASRLIEALFEVPVSARVGRLSVRGVGQAQVGPIAAATEPGPLGAVGSYAESAPRNLRPLLGDPVMSAIQSAAAQTLIVARDGNELTVEIPAAGVAGTVRSLGGGVYEALLKYGEHSLTCKLRSIRRGKAIILYLKDEPFHQLTYAKR